MILKYGESTWLTVIWRGTCKTNTHIHMHIHTQTHRGEAKFNSILKWSILPILSQEHVAAFISSYMIDYHKHFGFFLPLWLRIRSWAFKMVPNWKSDCKQKHNKFQQNGFISIWKQGNTLFFFSLFFLSFFYQTTLARSPPISNKYTKLNNFDFHQINMHQKHYQILSEYIKSFVTEWVQNFWRPHNLMTKWCSRSFRQGSKQQKLLEEPVSKLTSH